HSPPMGSTRGGCVTRTWQYIHTQGAAKPVPFHHSTHFKSPLLLAFSYSSLGLVYLFSTSLLCLFTNIINYLSTMEKPTPPQNPHPALAHQQHHPEQAPPNYDTREFSSPLAQPPLTNPGSPPPPVHQHNGFQQHDPNGFPPQTQQQQQQNLGSVPIQSLQTQSAPVVCPSCGARGMTVTTPESGGFTHAIAALVCFVSCLGCIPYCISSLKDVHHRCGNCGVPLADYHRSGRTEVRYWQK
ncbi:hypothetical protein FZEAL_10116, partial [Fusarium zealandicum]